MVSIIFFVLAPNLTIYNKLIADFTPNTPKYVFKGISEFAVNPPKLISGDNYEQQNLTMGMDNLFGEITINVFNISKINSEVRGGKEPKIKRMREVLGDSYFNYLANLPDLVLLMDESHRYRAQAGMRAINELNPLFGLELTATPFVESTKAPIPFKNVIVDYPLARAMDDGFVKILRWLRSVILMRKIIRPKKLRKSSWKTACVFMKTPRSSL